MVVVLKGNNRDVVAMLVEEGNDRHVMVVVTVGRQMEIKDEGNS